jgi:16S rRNA (guanine527-N7)-methyltransferase
MLRAMETALQEIVRGLQEMGIAATSAGLESISRHLSMVLAANQVMNLTSIDAADSVVLHVLDSCTALPFLEQAPAGTFADLGSGAGYPGIPLAILSGRAVALVESVGKKAAFLQHVVQDLRLNATVQPFRAEELALKSLERFAAVTARAVAALPSLVELAAPLLQEQGLLICMKGDPSEEEVRRGDLAATQCGLWRRDTTTVGVPGLEAARTVVVYERVGDPTVRLPRRSGMAQRRPFA